MVWVTENADTRVSMGERAPAPFWGLRCTRGAEVRPALLRADPVGVAAVRDGLMVAIPSNHARPCLRGTPETWWGVPRRIWPVIAALALLTALAGCGTEPPAAVPPGTQAPTQATIANPIPPDSTAAAELRSDKDRSVPSVGPADLGELVRGNNAFAFDLYHALSGREGNLFYSPFSISQALAMTSAGARGETLSQMEATLHHRLPQSSLHPAFNALDRTLASRGQAPGGAPNDAGEGGQHFRLNIANAIWGQDGYEFLPDFLDVLAANYGAGMMAVDFVGVPDEARVRINDWVAEETEGRIKDLLPPGIIDESTRLVLTNAIYFNASWHQPFSRSNTRVRPFHLAGGGTVDVPMMTETYRDYGYARGDGYQAVDLPYSWGELSMTILLPDEGKLGEFEGSLDSAMLDRIIDGIVTDWVTLTMPLFEFESEFSLGDALAEMGMPDAFGAEADFSGMTGSRALWISEVVHKAFVSVDEEGTEAAAATAVAMAESGPGKEPIAVTVDRPFIFLIRDTGTGTVLFLGRVSNPDPARNN